MKLFKIPFRVILSGAKKLKNQIFNSDLGSSLLPTSRDSFRMTNRTNLISLKEIPISLWIVLAVGFIVRIIFSVSLEYSIIHGISSDDSYYYFRIAQNIANGYGSTFDQLTLTNGYQPLVMIPLISIYSLFSSAEILLPVIVGQIILTVINIVAAIITYHLMIKLSNGSKLAAIMTVIILYLNPVFIAINFKSLETNLYWFFLVLALNYFLNIRESNSNKNDFIFGIIISLAALSRLDGAFLIIGFVFFVLFKQSWQLSLRVKKIFFTGLGFSLLFIPYLIYNQIIFGHFVPISGRAKVFHNHKMVLNEVGSYFSFDFVLYELKRFFFPINFDLFLHRGFGVVERIIVIAAIIFLAVILIYLFKSKLLHQLLSRFKGLGFLLLFLLFHYSFYTLYFWEYRFYYFLPEIITAALFFGLIVDELKRKWIRGGVVINQIWNKFSISVMVLIIAAYIFAARQIFTAQHEQTLAYKSSQWIKENIPPDKILGSANTGILSYFTQMRFVNLDGMVNNDELLTAFRHGDIGYLNYLKKYEIEYLCDYFLGPSPENKYNFPKILNDKYSVMHVVTDANLKYQLLNHMLIIKLKL